MFNLSFGEILVLSVIGLLVLGPKQLPQIARALGRGYNEFRKVFQDVTDVVKTEIKTDMLKKSVTNTIASAVLSDGLKVEEESSVVAILTTDAKTEDRPKKSIEEVMRELGK